MMTPIPPVIHSSLNPALIAAAREGDAAAVEQLLVSHHPSLTRFARRYCDTVQDAEDAVQETMWTIYRKINTLRVSSAFVSWTFQIVRHHCYLRVTAGSRRQTSHFTEVSLLDYIDHVGEECDMHALLKHDVVSAIMDLPPHYRQVVIMRDVEERSAPEVAEALGLTVKSRLHRARLQLREALAAWHE